jgi:hypothetical protein
MQTEDPFQLHERTPETKQPWRRKPEPNPREPSRGGRGGNSPYNRSSSGRYASASGRGSRWNNGRGGGNNHSQEKYVNERERRSERPEPDYSSGRKWHRDRVRENDQRHGLDGYRGQAHSDRRQHARHGGSTQDFFSPAGWKDVGASPEVIAVMQGLGMPRPSHVQASAYTALLAGASENCHKALSQMKPRAVACSLQLCPDANV